MSNYTHETVPTQFVETKGIRYAYRRFGQAGTVPLLFLQYFNSNLDGWDPAVTNGLATDHEVILFKGLRPGGVSIVVGVGPEPIEVMGMDLIFATRKIEGALTGTPAIGDVTLRFSALSKVSAMIETVSLEEAAAAYAKMMAGKARFRMVMVTRNVAGQSAR